MLTSQNVHETFMSLLFEEEEVIGGVPVLEPVYAQGVRIKVGFHPERVQQNKEKIADMLDQLPEEFHQGWSFLKLCTTKTGDLWTGDHQICDELVTMGIAIGRVSFPLPLDLIAILPGGVPYVTISKREDTNEQTKTTD